MRSLNRALSCALSLALLLSFLPAARLGAQAQVTAVADDGPQQIGDPLVTTTVTNSTAITFNQSAAIPTAASPYPSNITISGVAGTIDSNANGVSVTLNSLSHTDPTDIDIVLVGPTGARLMIMSDVTTSADATNANVTLSDAGAANLGNGTGTLTTGTYKPTDIDGPSGTVADSAFPSPAPGGTQEDAEPAPAGSLTFQSQYGGTDPNGTWSLYVVDDSNGDGGSIAGGWTLTINTTATTSPTTTTIQSSQNPSLRNQPVTFTATVKKSSDMSAVTEGTVTFKDGGVSGTNLTCTEGAQPRPLNGSGQATCTVAANGFTEGNHNIAAVYSGSANFGGSNATVNQRVDNPTTVNGTQFCNTGAITIPATGAAGEPATPYPSNVFVTGLTGSVARVTADLKGFTHTNPDDVDVMLVGPGGQKVLLMSDAGGSADITTPVNLTFDDNAATTLPDESTFGSGTYKPSDFNVANPDPFPAPAPAPPSPNTTMSTFNGTAPNGTWSLYVIDDTNTEGGSIANGWCVQITSGTVPGLGDVKISEFRLSGPSGTADEFVEIYNNTGAAITVVDASGTPTATPGWAIVSGEAPTVVKCLIPGGATIPARGHFLCVGTSYSLGTYPGGNGPDEGGDLALDGADGGWIGTGGGENAPPAPEPLVPFATGNATISGDIPVNRGIALFRSSSSALFNAANLLDAVGSNTAETNSLFKEGTGYPDLTTTTGQHSWVRRLPGGCTGSTSGFHNHNCTTPTLVETTGPPSSGIQQDTGNNTADFIYVDAANTAGSVNNQRLGAPGPENNSAPIVRGNPNGSGTINPSLIDQCAGSTAAPNRVRNGSGNSGSLEIRRRFTNNTGAPLTRLRFRVMDISTAPAPVGIAQLAAITSGDTVLNISVACGGGSTTARGLALESAAGGFNSSLGVSSGVISTGSTLANGASIDINFVFNITQTGKFRVFVIVEALP